MMRPTKPDSPSRPRPESRSGRLAAFVAALCIASPVSMRAALSVEWTRLPALPDPAGFAGMFAGSSRGSLIIAGGANFPGSKPWEGGGKVWHDEVFVLRNTGSDWRAAGRLPRPLAYGVAVSTEEGVLCIGGSDAAQHHSEVFLVSTENGTIRFTTLPSLPIPLASAAGALLGNTVYVAGGASEPGERSALNRLFALTVKPLEPSWRELEPCPGKARILPVAGAQAGGFYLIGGCALENRGDRVIRVYLRDGWCYRPGTGWRPIADLPHPMAAAPSPAPAIGQSHLLILGGDDGSNAGFKPVERHPGFSRSILAYHTITDTWTTAGDVAEPRVTAPVVEWNRQFIIPSGEVRPGIRTPAVASLIVTGTKAGFGWANYTALSLYLAAMVWLGASFTRRNRTTNDFFRGGQRVPWWAAGLSIFATMLSSITFMAIPAQSYSVGWNLFLGNSYLLLTPLVVMVYLPFYRSLNLTSAYEYLERRFNAATRLVASALFILFQLGRVAIVLYLPALALATVSNFDVTLCILLMGGLVIIYTVLGGIEAVIWTDAAQAVILLGGALWALVTVVSKVDGGAGAVLSTAAAQGRFFESVSWRWDYTIGAGWVILAGSLFANLFSYTASQDVVQRYVTTPDQKGAAKAIWINALVSPLAQGLFFAIGTGLFVFYRQHPERLDPTLQTDGIFPLFIVNELPAGVAGLIVAGIFAAAQSTLASSLNSIATAYVTDFHRRLRPLASDRSCLRLARGLIVVVGILGTGVAVALTRFDIRSLWETFLGVIGLFGGTISGLFVLGIFSRRVGGAGAVLGAVASAALVFAVRQFTAAHFFIYPVVGVASCVGLGWLGSLMLPPRVASLTGLTIYTLRPSFPESRNRPPSS